MGPALLPTPLSPSRGIGPKTDDLATGVLLQSRGDMRHCRWRSRRHPVPSGGGSGFAKRVRAAIPGPPGGSETVLLARLAPAFPWFLPKHSPWVRVFRRGFLRPKPPFLLTIRSGSSAAEAASFRGPRKPESPAFRCGSAAFPKVRCELPHRVESLQQISRHFRSLDRPFRRGSRPFDKLKLRRKCDSLKHCKTDLSTFHRFSSGQLWITIVRVRKAR